MRCLSGSMNEYTYTANTLECIAKSYPHIYQALELTNRYRTAEIYNITSIIDFKVDFDRALEQLPGRLKLLIEEVKNGTTDSDLEISGYYNVRKLKNIAFSLMAHYLNG